MQWIKKLKFQLYTSFKPKHFKSVLSDVWLWRDWGWADIGQCWVRDRELRLSRRREGGRLLLSGSASASCPCLATAWLPRHNHHKRCSAHTRVSCQHPAFVLIFLLWTSIFKEFYQFYNFSTLFSLVASLLDHCLSLAHSVFRYPIWNIAKT